MSESQDYKLCINCKHIGRNGSGNWETYRCFAPENIYKINLVTGDKDYLSPFCQEQRNLHRELLHIPREFCDPDGTWYEERPAAPEFSNLQNTEVSFAAQDLDSLAEKAAAKLAEIKNRKRAPKLSSEDLNNL